MLAAERTNCPIAELLASGTTTLKEKVTDLFATDRPLLAGCFLACLFRHAPAGAAAHGRPPLLCTHRFVGTQSA